MADAQGQGLSPSGEAIRSALRWLVERRREEPTASRMRLIEEAALRYDLSPLDVDFLANSWKE